MKTICVRTDKPEAELYIHDGLDVVAEIRWQAHRQLAETIHLQIKALLEQAALQPVDLTGVITYVGPGSFTGLRIGLSVTNALAYALNIDAVGAGGDDWIQDGVRKIAQHPGPSTIMPEYGADANITQPKK